MAAQKNGNNGAVPLLDSASPAIVLPDGRPYSFGQIKDNGKRVQDGGSLDAPQLGSVEPEPLNFRVFLTAPLWSWSGVNLRRGGYDS